MPSILSRFVSEPVNLESSGDSPYEPPHRASTDKALAPVSSAKSRLANGGPVDGFSKGKRVEGVFLGETDGVNSSLQSLPNGRTSDSTDSREKAHSRNGSNYSMTNGCMGNGDSEKPNPGIPNGLAGSNSIDQTLPSQARPNTTQVQRPRSRENTQHGKGYHKGHARAHSSSAPQTHNIQPSRTNNLEGSPIASEIALAPQPSTPTPSRFSSPPVLPNANQTPAGSSTTSLHPGVPRLYHRHTLEVPRVSTSRTSRDFSYPNTASDGGSDSGRFSPAPRTPRASNTLARVPTRSIHSDMYLDDIPPDGDMARWTETVRQKRASRRRRKEEEEDDRVVVGTKVDMNHVNWVTAYNMLTGIRFTVSRINAKIDRDLTDADFDARHKFSFDM